jgi:hypothetical protein
MKINFEDILIGFFAIMYYLGAIFFWGFMGLIALAGVLLIIKTATIQGTLLFVASACVTVFLFINHLR